MSLGLGAKGGHREEGTLPAGLFSAQGGGKADWWARQSLPLWEGPHGWDKCVSEVRRMVGSVRSGLWRLFKGIKIGSCRGRREMPGWEE